MTHMNVGRILSADVLTGGTIVAASALAYHRKVLTAPAPGWAPA